MFCTQTVFYFNCTFCPTHPPLPLGPSLLAPTNRRSQPNDKLHSWILFEFNSVVAKDLPHSFESFVVIHKYIMHKA